MNLIAESGQLPSVNLSKLGSNPQEIQMLGGTTKKTNSGPQGDITYHLSLSKQILLPQNAGLTAFSRKQNPRQQLSSWGEAYSVSVNFVRATVVLTPLLCWKSSLKLKFDIINICQVPPVFNNLGKILVETNEVAVLWLPFGETSRWWSSKFV